MHQIRDSEILQLVWKPGSLSTETKQKTEFLLLSCWLLSIISMETYHIFKNKLSVLISFPLNGWNFPCFNLANIYFQEKREENWHHRLERNGTYFISVVYCCSRKGIISFCQLMSGKDIKERHQWTPLQRIIKWISYLFLCYHHSLLLFSII